MGNAFEKGNKLELARTLAQSPGLLKKEEFLVEEHSILSERLKEILTVLIPSVVSLIGVGIALLTTAGILASPHP